jgi:hypothetical protein
MLLKIETLMWLLPIFFMIHDFEEIIMMKPWLEKNAAVIQKRFPRLAAGLLPRLQRLSPAAYTFIVAQLFLSLSFITFVSVEFSLYGVWLGFLLVFLLHLLIHIAQYVIFRGYVPVIFTSIFSLVYAVFALVFLINAEPFVITDILIWMLIAGLVSIGAFMFFFRQAGRFEDWLKNYAG